MTTSELALKAKRYDGSAAFFACFPQALKDVRQEILKFETRQTYKEPGNPSWELLVQGDYRGAVDILPQTREADVPLYESLKSRNVRFVRCRTVSFPLTEYLQWEIECYRFNSAHGEDIYFLDPSADGELLAFARNDFMIFDDKLAMIHDYDDEGLIQGGWELSTRDLVGTLREQYLRALDRAEPYCDFLARRGA